MSVSPLPSIAHEALSPTRVAIPMRRTSMVEVRKASQDDSDACARVLAAAFQDDPGTVNFEPNADRRRVVLPRFFRTFVAAALAEQGDLVVAGDPVEGIASWFGPDQHGPSPDAMNANGFGDVLSLAGPQTA